MALAAMNAPTIQARPRCRRRVPVAATATAAVGDGGAGVET
jgi:hypothetical protein